MNMSLRRFRSEVRQLADGKAPRAVRYPVALRDAAVKLGRVRLRQGHSLAATARALRILSTVAQAEPPRVTHREPVREGDRGSSSVMVRGSLLWSVGGPAPPGRG